MSVQGRNGRVLLNFCLVCGIWGSTFLAVKYAIDGIPPFVVTAGRYLTASVVLFGISRWKRESRLGARNLGVAAISGFLLSLANALVCYSETALPSGLVAVVIGSLPAWIILLDWQLFRGKAPRWGQVGGICLSLVGVAALTGGQSHHFDSRNLLIWVALISSIGIWAVGTLIQRSASLRGSLFQFSAVQSATGGMLIGITAAADQNLNLDWGQIPLLALLAVVYLALAGTVVASTSYVWLSQNADPRLVSTYALITPVVAVWLGWLLAGEEVTFSTLGNSVIVLAGVALIVLSGKFPSKLRQIGSSAAQVTTQRSAVIETVRPLAEVVSGS
jgi:drug/metabolite transporter (DMT)-like permease